ncbi:MAG: dihydrofolate reductase [Myxococcales bacterium]|nr:MAG: dihydrofolate reductase [Myxococcales bacterium]
MQTHSHEPIQQSGEEFSYVSEQFSDLRILRYEIPGFDQLTLKQKELAYYLSEAARSGRDIYWDQNYKHNLRVRRIIEQIVMNFTGDKTTQEYQNFLVYAKRVWFSNGIHHHYSNDKILPTFSKDYFSDLIKTCENAQFPLLAGESVDELIQKMTPIIFDPIIGAKKVNLDENIDKIKCSAVNFYQDLSEEEVAEYYRSLSDANDPTPLSHGLNSKKIKLDGRLHENVYKVGGLYGEAISEIVKWLEKALMVAESDLQASSIAKLIEYYKTGDLKKFDEYNILWVQDTDSVVDTVNGFIEVYDDPLGHTGSWEAVASIKDLEATKRFGVLSHEAQWFEDNSPILDTHKRTSVTGVSYKIINVVAESGASSPSTPIGINLPNADWIRKLHGSKSVSLGSIEHAYNQASHGTTLDEFYLSAQKEWILVYGDIADKLHTGLHEVIGHASGQLEEGVQPPHVTLGSYASALEEARADLVGLYYIGDQHLVDIGVSPSTEIIKASYTQYINNGLLKQMARIDLGKNIEESHMRNRQMIAAWAYEHGRANNVIERYDLQTPEGLKTYFVVNDFQALRELFGELLKEVQRIKSQGDFEAGKNLIENYGVRVDETLHRQVKQRWEKLGVAPYAGFINPQLVPVYNENQELIDVEVSYPNDFVNQMLDYGLRYSFLPHYPN